MIVTLSFLVIFTHKLQFFSPPVDLPTVVAELLVELDIVNTQEVQQIRATGTLEVGVQPTTAPGNRSDTRQRKAAVGSNSMKWPNHRIPYLFHGFISKPSYYIKLFPIFYAAIHCV